MHTESVSNTESHRSRNRIDWIRSFDSGLEILHFRNDIVRSCFFVVSSVVVLFAAMLAYYIPAHRAAKIDPMEALRYE